MKKKETEFLTDQEGQVMLRVPDRRTLQGKRDYAILLTLLTTGLRKAEFCNFKVGDLKTYRNQAIIDIIGKGQKFPTMLGWLVSCGTSLRHLVFLLSDSFAESVTDP